jgi:hypothetical protein
MNKKYIVSLTPTEKNELEQLIRAGKAAARKLTHARILLKANSCDSVMTTNMNVMVCVICLFAMNP